MKINLIPTDGRLLVKVIEDKETRTSGGILLAQPVNQSIHYGIVESAGPKLKDSVIEFMLGDKVYWQQYSGVEIEEDGDKYIIINQKDIIALVPVEPFGMESETIVASSSVKSKSQIKSKTKSKKNASK